MKQRIITAIIMLAVLGCIIFLLPLLFVPAVALMLGVSIWEWCRICKFDRTKGYIFAGITGALWLLSSFNSGIFTLLIALSACHYVYALIMIYCYERNTDYTLNSTYLFYSGPVILSALAASLIYIFHENSEISSSDDAMSLLFIIMVIAAADSGAYFCGRALGKKPLSPRVSPKKTIEGLLGGLACVILVTCLFSFMVEGWYLNIWQLAGISIFAALYSVIGDLFISIIKRQNNIKDSSNILPGHGGVLDRIDGLLAGVPLFYLLQQFI